MTVMLERITRVILVSGMTGLSADGRYVFTESSPNYGLFRLGVRLLVIPSTGIDGKPVGALPSLDVAGDENVRKKVVATAKGLGRGSFQIDQEPKRKKQTCLLKPSSS